MVGSVHVCYVGLSLGDGVCGHVAGGLAFHLLSNGVAVCRNALTN